MRPDDLDGIRMQLDAIARDAALRDEARFAERAAALDLLEFPILPALAGGPDEARAAALQDELLAVNERLFQHLRATIAARSHTPAGLLRLLRSLAQEQPIPQELPPAAAELPYDALDALVGGVLACDEPPAPEAALPPGLVGYQPTPARVVLDMIARTGAGPADVFVDLGSGLGHVAILVALLSGAAAVGVEIQQAYCAAARRCAGRLGLSNVSFLNEDARSADLSRGTIFYMYTPFTGAALGEVLDRLRGEASRRAIRVCAYGPYLSAVAEQPWLTHVEAGPAPESPLRVFTSCRTEAP